MSRIAKRKNRTKSVSAAQAKVGYILSPRLDFWMTGGISIVVMCGLLLYIALRGGGPQAGANMAAIVGSAFVLQMLVNWPHFMGAYGLLYRPRGNIRKYPMATLYVPLALLATVVVSITLGRDASGSLRMSVDQDVAYFIWLGAAFYLAWHYTGQAWGMIATFSRLSGVDLDRGQRWVVRNGLRLLLAWHVVWGAQDLPPGWLGAVHGYLPQLLLFVSCLCIVAFLAGIRVWLNIRQRTGRLPDARILASWLSIYLWYLVLYFMPEAYLWVQFSHALQYLAFPLRVELNRRAATTGSMLHGWGGKWGLRHYAMLLVSGVAVFYMPQYLSDSTQQYTFALVVASCVSIHHYFVDSCIWKVSNPEVRQSLFAHLGAVHK